MGVAEISNRKCCSAACDVQMLVELRQPVQTMARPLEYDIRPGVIYKTGTQDAGFKGR